MTEALRDQQARPLAPLITDFVRYSGYWWIASPDGWLRITDPDLARTLDRQHQRFAKGLF
ncbi:hypothetical protein [Kineosporia babensis]|uniref:Uncharacterized protein n=1 Tax=Kineosporia babensis TaxID=499548 RepID=A0A9X1NMA1_9ACTN|nr:hypothetical protein [Kineosporia babensis]MCD5316174.1 hypothetical protein [Kineosporia babensis]